MKTLLTAAILVALGSSVSATTILKCTGSGDWVATKNVNYSPEDVVRSIKQKNKVFNVVFSDSKMTVSEHRSATFTDWDGTGTYHSYRLDDDKIFGYNAITFYNDWRGTTSMQIDRFSGEFTWTDWIQPESDATFGAASSYGPGVGYVEHVTGTCKASKRSF